MNYNAGEKAEEKIAKQALLEALFQTQIWNEPYIKNPFIYVTDKESDFEGDEGKKLQTYFTKVFYSQFKKFKAAVDVAVQNDAYLARSKVRDSIEKWKKIFF